MSRRRGCLELNSTWLKLPLKHVFTLSLAFIAGYSFYHYRVARQLSPFPHYWDQTSSASSSDDPTVGPGWLNHWRWVPAKEGVVMHGFLDKFIEKRGGNVVGTAGNDEHGDDEMDWARNRTILFIGDSVGRELQNAWCRAIGVDRKSIKLNDEDEVNDKTTTSICEHAFYGVKTVFSFLYGMTNYTKPGASDVISGEWPPGPWGYEDRLPEVKQQLDRLNELSLQKGADSTREDGKKVYEPDLIVLNSGAWEFKYMYRRDLKQGLKAYDIQWDELHELAERLKGAINLIRDLWPDAELVWVDVQPFDTNDFGARWFCQYRGV
ncbi:hypothetical protein QFC21_005866 [Naganishia friedmannii]|uniref:Uncharacterized protein n=1 Tax=Naganishia friedmannii TaxID=89922 RepID=A0ACC2V6U7_9TREE|nr:hypothetical protein QFC21_005866 [Naganishia friedmannii]